MILAAALYMAKEGIKDEMNRRKTPFGMPTLMAMERIEDNIALAEELGLQFIEVHLSLPPYRLETIDAGVYRDLAARAGLFYTFHIFEEFSYAGFHTALRQTQLAVFADVLRLALAVESPIVNIHMERGMYFTLPEGRRHFLCHYRDHHLQSLRDFRALCEDTVGGGKLKVSIENTSDFHIDYIREASEFLLESPVFSLTWDVGHDQLNDGRDGDFFVRHLERVAHFHMHDAAEGLDHRPFGEGKVPIAERFALAERLGASCLLEVKYEEGLRRSLAFLASCREEGKGAVL